MSHVSPIEADGLAAIEKLLRDRGFCAACATDLAIEIADVIDDVSGTDLAGKWGWLANEAGA